MRGRNGGHARALTLICQLCDGTHWVQSAPVTTHVTGEGERAFVGEFSPVPCWACGPSKLKVIAWR